MDVHITKLLMGWNKIGTEGAVFILNALQNNRKLLFIGNYNYYTLDGIKLTIALLVILQMFHLPFTLMS